MKPAKLRFEDFRSFERFPDDILKEIIREGERELDARLATANATDQRVLSVLGFQIALALAVCGGLFSLLSKSPIDKFLLLLGLALLIGLVVSGAFAYLSVIPKLIVYPGNSPSSWFIKDWHISPDSEENSDLQSARLEQCYCLYSAIYENKIVMEDNVKLLKNSMACMISTVGAVFFIYLASVFIRLFE